MAKQTAGHVHEEHALCGGGLAIFVVFALFGDKVGLAMSSSVFAFRP